MLKPTITVIHLSKAFLIPTENRDSLQQKFINIFQPIKKNKFNVLRDISFNVNKGDWIGLIGRNGSGKSTLLKLLSGIYSQDAGEVKIRGRIVQFLELGVGFNQDLTGRENIYLNGIVMGMSHKEVDRKFDRIVEFAEIKKFLDLPLKNYSSGMKLRLAFAVAANIDADVYLLDEVLAVGDMNFQKKSLSVFNRLKHEGKTVILVSHNMNQIREYCNKAIYLKDGKIRTYSNTEDVANIYEDDMLSQKNISLKRSSASKDLKIISLKFIGINGKAKKYINAGTEITAIIKIQAIVKLTDIVVSLKFLDASGNGVMAMNNLHQKVSMYPGETVKVKLSGKIPFNRGHYSIDLSIAEASDLYNFRNIISREQIVEFEMISDKAIWGEIYNKPKVTIKKIHAEKK